MDSLISVVVPIHNAEKYLEKCLNSIIHQTYTNLEIILINDSSADNSERVCFEFMKRDKRIKYFSHNEGSAGLTRNYGIDRANGEYIVFVDADDFIDEYMCEKLYTAMMENNSQACFCGYNELSDKNENRVFSKGTNIINYDEEKIKNDLLFNAVYVENISHKLPLYAVWNGMYKVEIIKKYNIRFFDEKTSLSEDSIFNYAYISKCKNVTLINEALYNHVLYNQNSICSKYNTRYNYIDSWYEHILNLSANQNINYEELQYRLNERYIEFTIVRIRQEILLRKGSIFSKIKQIKNILNGKNLKKIIKDIEFKNKSSKRKVLLFLIKKRFAFLIYTMIGFRKK